MTAKEQLEEWLKGNPIHNKERDECCPDFSCCRGNIVEKELRERFVKAWKEKDQKIIDAMLMMFLSCAYPTAYITGLIIQGGNNQRYAIRF